MMDIAESPRFFATVTASTSNAPLFVRLGGRARLLYLLRHFYADVRQHEEIGPIFSAHITDWPAHLEKITDFWSGPPEAQRSTAARCRSNTSTSDWRNAILLRGSICGKDIAGRTFRRSKLNT